MNILRLAPSMAQGGQVKGKKQIEERTAPNRTVYASPPVGGSAPGCACSTTLFCFVLRPCGLPLSTEWTWTTAQNKGAHGGSPRLGSPPRHIQPER